VPEAWLFPLPLPKGGALPVHSASTATAGEGAATTSSSSSSTSGGPPQALLTSPVSLLAALQLDQHHTQLVSPHTTSRPATASSGGAGASAGSAAGRLNAAAVAKAAARQLVTACTAADGSLGSPTGCSRRGGFKGCLSHTRGLRGGAAAPAPEPGVHEASIRAASLFRPGSAISAVGGAAAARSLAAATTRRPAGGGGVLASTLLAPGVAAAVVANSSSGQPQLEFHGVAAVVHRPQ
jgi:hypothetical protein